MPLTSTASSSSSSSSSFLYDSVREVTAGALSGALTKTLAAPLDRLKLVVQLQGSITSQVASQQAQGPWLALRHMIRTEGIWALWRGNVPTILIQGGTSALNFLFMDWYKKLAVSMVDNNNHQHNTPQPYHGLAKSFLSGLLAGATALTLLYPLGVMRTKLALDMGRGDERLYPHGMRDVVRHAVRVNGWRRGLYPGYAVALVSVSVYRMVHLGGYDYCKTVLLVPQQQQQQQQQSHSSNDDQPTIPWGQRLVAAQSVSLLASTVHYPADSVRRRLMMQSDVAHPVYRNAWHCVVTIYRNEGMTGFFRGLATNYVRSISAALLLVSYDVFKGILSK